MSECANFQSKLDGRVLDVSKQMLRVVLGGQEYRGKLHFVQVYTDSPHMHITLAYKHPVSGLS